MRSCMLSRPPPDIASPSCQFACKAFVLLLLPLTILLIFIVRDPQLGANPELRIFVKEDLCGDSA